MQFAIILLVILAAACTVGSLVTQGQTYEWYAAQYSERTAGLIIALHLDDAFHSWWFLLINAFLCLNLFMCNLIRLPQLIQRVRNAGDPEKAEAGKADVTIERITDPKPVFETLHMPKPVRHETQDSRIILFAAKNRAGLWGAWVCHLGILLLILGFGLGQMTKEQYAAYGVPGQSREIGDTGMVLTIDDFRVDLREDDTVEQYTADITVRDLGASELREESASISVNHPARLFGMKFYQNSTGWAATMRVYKEDALLQETVLCAGDYAAVEDMPELVVYLNAFYPDFAMDGKTPMTVSGSLNNPAYLYSVYYQNQIIGMNALLEGEEIKIDDYVVTFSEPQNYTVIQIKKDSFTWLAFVGGIVTMLGLLLAFYLLPSKVWAVQAEDGLWTVKGESRKGGALFRERFLEAAEALQIGEVQDESDAAD